MTGTNPRFTPEKEGGFAGTIKTALADLLGENRDESNPPWTPLYPLFDP
jgi:hypothetical protein